MRILLAFIFLLALPTTSLAELRLDPPQTLVSRAEQGKNQLRDVLNEIDQNLTEIRDGRTFDTYFALMDRLQELAHLYDLDSIYPGAVKKVANRMVIKGVNWLDVVTSSKEKVLYYHRWMAEPQPAFGFLYAAALRVKEEENYENLKAAAINLQAALLMADEKWVDERSLRLLYRSTISGLAAKVLKKKDLAETETEFWISKLYSAEAMSEIVTYLQGQVYEIRAETKSTLHWATGRARLLYGQASLPTFGAPEALLSQIGDTAVDIVMKSFRFEERLTDEEYEGLLSVMTPRHFAALANSWAAIGKVPKGPFGAYYIQRAFKFIAKLEALSLRAEAILLSTAITEKAAAILGRQDKIEGKWAMKDASGMEWTLVVIHASDDLVFASFSDTNRFTHRAYYHVVYDMKRGGYIATERIIDTDNSPNLPLRFVPTGENEMIVEDLMFPRHAKMKAKRVQSFPDYIGAVTENAPDMNGVYEGEIVIPGGTRTHVTLVVTVFNGYSVGNMRFLNGHSNSTFNYGSPATDGSIYLTRGSDSYRASGTWMHLRGVLDKDGYLRGHTIYGHEGLVTQKFKLKKTK